MDEDQKMDDTKSMDKSSTTEEKKWWMVKNKQQGESSMKL